MPYDPLNLGAVANDRTGDDWRSGGEKINTMFSELFGASSTRIILSSKDDFLANGVLVGDEITLNVAAYYYEDIDLGADVVILPGGALLEGSTASISRITTNSVKPTITARAGGFAVCAIVGTGGARINNTGGGAAIRVQDTDTICAIRRIFTSECGTALEIHDSNVLLDSWTVLGSVNGVVLTGTLSNGPIISNFNPIGLTGKGIFIDGSIASGALRINEAIINESVGNAVEVGAGHVIQGMSFSGDAISTTGNGIKIAGEVAGGLLLQGTNILSYASDAMDITGGELSALIGSTAGITAIASGMSALKGNAQSDTSILPNGGNITAGGNAIFSICQINNPVDLTVEPLSGITKKDLQYRFISAGARITDSADIGGFTLDAQTNTVFGFQGFDGVNTAYADSLTAPGARTLVTSAGHSLANGTHNSIVGTTSYNGLHLVSNVLTNSYEIPLVFVADDATGDYQSGWVKLAGPTTDVEAIERFNGLNDNEIELLDTKTLPLTYTAIISGEKSGSTPRLVQFGLFLDSGLGFVKVDGEATIDVINRLKSTTLRVPFEMSTGGLATLYARNTEGTETLILDELGVDIGRS